MAGQSVTGDNNVQIHGVAAGASIQISIGAGPRRRVPLEQAVVPPGPKASPARLVRARSGVVPFAARLELLEVLQEWLVSPVPFAGVVIGGAGGAGKTHLGVELCRRAAADGWLAGLLATTTDEERLEALAEAPIRRLVIVDYAETRAEHLEVVLPYLSERASAEHPVRVMALVRARPQRGVDWTEALRGRRALLDAVVDEFDQHLLEEEIFDTEKRRVLFSAAGEAFASRAGLNVPEPPGSLGLGTFASPLLVVVAAYLAVHHSAVPTTRTDLLEGLVAHEANYWAETARAAGVDADPELRRRVVALATLSGAGCEDEAAEVLRLVADLGDARAERRRCLARWVHGLYPGPRWWNPLEPDLVGEHLVATCYGDQPGVLAGALERVEPASLLQPLDTYARAAAERPSLAEALRPVLGAALGRLVDMAVAQSLAENDLKRLLGGRTLAEAIDRAVAVVKVEPTILPSVVDTLPDRPDLVIGPLAVSLREQAISGYRRLAANDPAHEGDLALALNKVSFALARAGRWDEALTAATESVGRWRAVVAAAPDLETARELAMPRLASALSNLSICMAHEGRRDQGIAAIEEAVSIRRKVAAQDPAAKDLLAGALVNLSIYLSIDRPAEALTVVREAVGIYRALDSQGSDLAEALIGLSNRLAEANHSNEALEAAEEAVALYRNLAATRPSIYASELARWLINLSMRLRDVGRPAEALAASEEAAAWYRQLEPARTTYEP